MDIRELITSEERDMIDYYRRTYGPKDEQTVSNSISFASTDKYLEEWAKEKESLFHAFGDKLIVSFPVEFEQSPTEIEGNICDDWDNWTNLPFFNRFDKWARTEGDSYLTNNNSRYYSNYGMIYNLVLTKTIATQKVRDELVFSNFGKTITIQKGSKPMRALRKLNNEFGIATKEEFIEFEQYISKFFNQKKIKGTFNLSIHPLDYLTMSDNNSDWSSCMSWADYGCYRRGTVEMMNSNNAVVGYIASDNKKYKIHGEEWNNKKWRVLYVVTPEIISSVKAYPYFNESYIEAGLNKLRELMGGDYSPYIETTDENCFEIMYKDNENDAEPSSHFAEFTTDAMYNDFGCSTTHYFIPNVKAFKARYGNRRYNYISYSGMATCAWCGYTHDSGGFAEPGDDENSQSELICYDCDESYKCACCGDRLNNCDDYYTVDGQVCRWCYEEHYEYCEIEEDYYHKDAINYVYLAKRDEEGNPVISPFSIKVSDKYVLETDNVFEKVYHQDYLGIDYVFVDEFISSYYSITELVGRDWDYYADNINEFFFVTDNVEH